MQMRLYGVAFILAGVIMLIITVVEWLKVLSFKNCAVTEATVTGVNKSSRYINKRRRVIYLQTVAYNVDGIAYQRDLPCDADEYDLGADRKIEIRYKSHNPKKIIPNDVGKQHRAQKTLWIITLALLAIGVAMLFIPIG